MPAAYDSISGGATTRAPRKKKTRKPKVKAAPKYTVTVPDKDESTRTTAAKKPPKVRVRVPDARESTRSRQSTPPTPDQADRSRTPAQKKRDAAAVKRTLRTTRSMPKAKPGRVIDATADFAARRAKSRQQVARRVAPVVKVLDQTTRVNHAIAGATDAAITGKNVPDAALKGIKNEEKKTFSDVLTDAGWNPKGALGKTVKGVVATTLDIGTDPTTYVAFGAGSAAKQAAVKTARQAEKTAAKSTSAKVSAQKAETQAVKQGATPKAAKQAGKTAARTHAQRAGKKAGDAAAQGKATNNGLRVSFAGRDVPVITRATSAAKRGPRAAARKTRADQTRVGRKIDRAQQRVRDTSRNLVSDFNPAIAPAGVDRVAYQAARRSARTARAGAQRGTYKAGQRAIAFRKAIGEKNYTRVIDAIENGTVKSLPKNLRGPARELQRDFARMRKTEVRSGLKVGDKGDTYVKHLRIKPHDTAGGAPSVGSKRVAPSFGKARKEGTIAEKNTAEPGAYSEDIADIYLNRGAESAVAVSKAKLNQAMVHAGRKPDRTVKISHQLGEHETLYKVDGSNLVKVDPKSAEARALPKGNRYVILNEKLLSRTRGTVNAAAERSTAGVFFDRAQGVWKLAATQINPGYHVRNFAGEAQNAYLAENPVILGRNAVQAARALRQLGRDEDALRVLGKQGPGREPSTKRTVTETRVVRGTREEPLDQAAQKSITRRARRKSGTRPEPRVKVSADDAFSTRALPIERTGGTPHLAADKTEWFHGTPTKFEGLPSAKGQWSDLGVYLTSDPNYARGYANAPVAAMLDKNGERMSGHIVPIRVNPKRVLDMRAGRHSPGDMRAVIASMRGRVEEAIQKELDSDVYAAPKTPFRARREATLRHNWLGPLDRWEDKLAKGGKLDAEQSAGLQETLQQLSERAGAALGMKGTGNRHQLLAQAIRDAGFDAIRKVDLHADALVVLDESIMRRVSGSEGAPATRMAPTTTTETTTRVIKQRGKRKPEKRYQGIDIRTAENVGAVRAGQLGREVGDMLRGQSAKHGKLKARSRVLTRKPARALKNVEDVFRLATYKSGIDRGLKPEQAMERASRYHFDYGDLTPLERKVLRRVAPFWTFSARNIPLQARVLLTRPGKFANYQKVREELQNAFGVPDDWENDLSESEQRSAPFPVKIDGKTYTISLGPSGLPLTDLNEFPSSGNPLKQADEWMERAMSMLTPAAKTPVELWANMSFFFRDQIEKDDAPLAPAPAWVGAIPEKYRKQLGITKNLRDPQSGKSKWGAPAKIVYALNVLPGPASFANRLATESDRPGQSTAAKTVQYVGPRVRQVDPVTTKINNLYEERAKITKRSRALAQQNLPGTQTKISAKSATPEYRRLLDREKELTAQIDQLRRQRGDANAPRPRRPRGAAIRIPGTGTGKITVPGTGRIKIP